MKKNSTPLYSLITLIGLMCIGSPTWSQISLGLRSGASFSTMNTNTEFAEGMLPGLHAGLVGNIAFSDVASIQAEVLYNEKGYNHIICSSQYDKFKATYIEVPVLFKYAIKRFSGNLSLNVNGGMFLGFWRSAQYVTNVGDGEFKEDYRIGPENNTTDFGPAMGLGLDYRVGPGRFSVDFRYEKGMVDMNSRFRDTVKNTNSTLMGSFSYAIVF
jgi:hypothetical protein